MMNFQVPYDEELEKSVVGAVLIHPEIFVVLSSILAPDEFFIKRHEFIWQAMGTLYDNGHAIERKALRRVLEDAGHLNDVGGDLYISEVMNSTPSALYAEQYAHLVKRDAISRALIKAAHVIHDAAHDRNRSLEDKITLAEQEIWGIGQRSVMARDVVTARESTEAVLDHLQLLEQGDRDAVGIPTGFSTIDAITGGLHRSDFVIYAGRPGMGKTSFALSLMRNVNMADGRVLYFSLEMNHEQLTQRLVSMETGVQMQKLRGGGLNEAELKSTINALGQISQRQYFVDDSPSLNPAKLRARASRVHHQYGLDLIIIDYIQLMDSGADFGGNRVQEMTYISRQVKELARELNVPIIANAQLSRALEQRRDKRPKLSDLRESGSLEQDADMVAFIYRDVVYNESTENPNEAEIIIAKQRNGPTDTRSLYFDSASTLFTDGVRQSIDLSTL
jgi:replicative DNA helicase